jgi:hypothetical protein
VGKILARQLGGYAKNDGKRVVFFSFQQDEQQQQADNAAESLMPRQRGIQTIRDMASGAGGPGPQLYGNSSASMFLSGTDFDLMVVYGISSHFYDKTGRELAETVTQLGRLAKQGRTFVLCSEAALLGEKNAAYIRAAADSVIIVKTDLIGDLVNRMLYVTKLNGSAPPDKLIKITVDDTGVQEDTREFVG